VLREGGRVMSERKLKSIKVEFNVWQELVRLQGELQKKQGKRVSMSDTIQYLLDRYYITSSKKVSDSYTKSGGDDNYVEVT